MLADTLRQLAAEHRGSLIVLQEARPHTRGEVIMHPRKAENVLCTLSAWEGITSNSAVLEQVSGKPLSHDGRALTQPGRLQPPGRGLSLLRVGVQGKADRREGSGRRGS